MFSDMSTKRHDVWAIGYSPINTEELDISLQNYPHKDVANLLSDGFHYGFKLQYEGPRLPSESKNLKSVLQNPLAAIEKVENEIKLGRIAGPFDYRPISNLKCSPIGLVPKKTSGWRLITHLSYPPSESVNDFINPEYCSVKYSSFDNAVSIVKKLGKNALIAKMDIKSAFRLLPCYPGDFCLLGFKIGEKWYIDKNMPMGCSISCATWEHFAKFLDWLTKKEAKSNNLDHFLDDYFFAGKFGTNECQILMDTFTTICQRLNVPIAEEKTEGPKCIMEYLGLIINTNDMTIEIPQKKLKDLLNLIKEIAYSKKVTLKRLQSLCGTLAFCTRAIPAGRAFSRRLYMAMSKGKKPFHLIRITKEMFNDLMIWKMFLENFNGVSYILEDGISNDDIQLYTDSSGGFGCGCYFMGKWCYLQWPLYWRQTGITRDITFLEIIPIALSVFLWYDRFKGKTIVFHIDNLAVVTVLNSKYSKSERVMNLLRFIVYWSMIGHFNLKAFHIFSKNNSIADSLSRGHFQKFRQLAPQAEQNPVEVPLEFWNLLN